MIKKFNITDVTGSHVVGDRAPKYVLATDYAALEARMASLDQKFMILQGSHDLLVKERDEWRARCGAMTGELHKAMMHSNPELISKHMSAALAIAEGRDNG